MSLKHAILVLLETEPSSGYDLLQHFKQSLGYFWNAKHQQIYQQLKKLLDEKLIEFTTERQEGRPDKKIYRITAKGTLDLKEWIAAPVKPNKVNDALLVKFYGGHLTSQQNLQDELTRHHATHSNTLTQLLAIEDTYLQLPEAKQQQYKLPYLTLRRGILGEKAWLAWAEEVKKTINI